MRKVKARTRKPMKITPAVRAEVKKALKRMIENLQFLRNGIDEVEATIPDANPKLFKYLTVEELEDFYQNIESLACDAEQLRIEAERFERDYAKYLPSDDDAD